MGCSDVRVPIWPGWGIACSRVGWTAQRSGLGWGDSEPTVPDLRDLLMNECVRDQKQVPSQIPARWMAGLGHSPRCPPAAQFRF